LKRRTLYGCIVLLLVVGKGTSCGERLFFFPDRGEVGTGPDVFFPSRDGTRLHGWYFPAAGASRGVVVHCHGNAGHVGVHAGMSTFLARSGYDLLAFDYRGYGRSEGSPSRKGLLDDVQGAIDFAKSKGGRVLLFGQSLGASLAILAAAERPEVAAVVAEAPFTGWRAIARDVVSRAPLVSLLRAPLAWLLVGGGGDPVDAVASLSPRPLFLIHGERDEVIPPSMSKELFQAAGEPKELWIVEGARHLGLGGTEYERRIVEFLDAAPALGAGK